MCVQFGLLSLRHYHELKVFENKAQTGIFEPKIEDLRGGCGKLQRFVFCFTVAQESWDFLTLKSNSIVSYRCALQQCRCSHALHQGQVVASYHKNTQCGFLISDMVTRSVILTVETTETEVGSTWCWYNHSSRMSFFENNSNSFLLIQLWCQDLCFHLVFQPRCLCIYVL
jgi:hypothetical protein